MNRKDVGVASVIVIVVVVCMFLAIHVALPEMNETYEKIGRIAKIEHSAGGFGNPSITILEFESGEIMIFRLIKEPLTLGKAYVITYQKITSIPNVVSVQLVGIE